MKAEYVKAGREGEGKEERGKIIRGGSVGKGRKFMKGRGEVIR